MLKKLSVQNYILIDELDIHLNEGLTIITGETGAGKSILLGALALILGQRADAGSLLDKKKKCIIEGTFDVKNYQLQPFFEQHELDFENETVLRREINPEGKSRAFINDTPVNLNILKELAGTLVDIHSQHETLTLANSRFQLSVVDAFAKHQQQITNYHSLYNTYTKHKKELVVLKEEEAKSKADQDYFSFQFKEMDEVQLKSGEQEELEQELQQLTHAEEIKVQLSAASRSLNGDEENIIQHLSSVAQSLSNVARFDKKYEDLAARVRSAVVELKDISEEAEQLEEAVRFDPMRTEVINERLNVIYRLQQKHRVSSIEELITLRDSFNEKLNSIGTIEHQIEKLQLQLDKEFSEVIALANVISANRKKAIPGIEKEIKSLTTEMSMPNAALKVIQEVVADSEVNSDGLDKIAFQFSANKGGDFKDLGKVASGGELSRLMLAIKSIMAGLTSLPTIIFDEIDTGISGEVASRVGGIMQHIAEKHQVIAITHLPQIAGKGHSHYLVYKSDTKTTTRTGLRLLNDDERINEIARMLSGTKLTGAAIEHAKELMAS